MKKVMGIMIATLMIVPVFSLATGQNVSTSQLAAKNSRAIVDVGIYDFYFSPTPKTINVGDTVRWTNHGSVTHTTTSNTGLWDSGNMAPGATYSYTFNTEGTYAYHCKIHTYMTGVITTPQPPNTPTEPSGPATRNVGQLGNYSTMTTDPNGDQVRYRFDWNASGSHDYSSWSALVSSGTAVSMSHSWSAAGTYLVEAQANDSTGLTSGWSTGLSVLVSSTGNTPPNTPATPTGPTMLTTGQSGTYSTSSSDPDGDTIACRFDFDANGAHEYTGYSPLLPGGTTISMSHTWNVSGTYVVKAQALDSYGYTSNWSIGLTVVVSSGNSPPITPTVTGPSQVKKGVSAEITAMTTDPDGDMIMYYFDFGDSTNSGWTAMVNSGTAAHVNHTWAKTGSYTVKVRAMDVGGHQSANGTLPITVPATSSASDRTGLFWSILQRLLQWFPFLFSVLQL
ncbi:MAG TPA: PKD domain-containing protein [Candidatus Thermoplasmatota archaeon]|nr:PKD domain-containing protein [Candidatus Thermoplasmatota archaeon]